MSLNPLGKDASYSQTYDPTLLFAIARKIQREQNGADKMPFKGFDVWKSFELSWLSPSGKPEVRVVKIAYSADSENIIESKSLKLYLCSFIMSTFESEQDVENAIKKDLKAALKAPYLNVDIRPANEAFKYTLIDESKLLDSLEVEIDKYEVDADILTLTDGSDNKIVECFSNLLKSNCPITGQPDWATVHIRYKASTKIDEKSLLKYIISYRNHQGYHEACCEMIFTHLFTLLKPDLLTVECCFTRRGGIDINPIRSFGEDADQDFNCHYWRQ